MKKISAIINARLESTRIKKKMIRNFCGTTLIDIALEKLNKLDFFDYRFFAVAEEELINIGKKYKNIEILLRSKESVAKGSHPSIVTFEHYTRVPTEYLFVINACLPFLSIETIYKAYEIFQKTNYKSYLSVIPTREWIFTQDGIPLTHKDPLALQNTTDVQIYYKASHGFYIINRDSFIRTNGILWMLVPGDPYLIEMPIEESYDVDNEIQFEFVSYIYAKFKKNG